MTQENLASHIGYIYCLHENLAVKIKNKLNIGASCHCEIEKLINSSYVIKELENYYNDCSCLTEEDICSMLLTTENLLK